MFLITPWFLRMGQWAQAAFYIILQNIKKNTHAYDLVSKFQKFIPISVKRNHSLNSMKRSLRQGRDQSIIKPFGLYGIWSRPDISEHLTWGDHYGRGVIKSILKLEWVRSRPEHNDHLTMFHKVFLIPWFNF